MRPLRLPGRKHAGLAVTRNAGHKFFIIFQPEILRNTQPARYFVEIALHALCNNFSSADSSFTR